MANQSQILYVASMGDGSKILNKVSRSQDQDGCHTCYLLKILKKSSSREQKSYDLELALDETAMSN